MRTLQLISIALELSIAVLAALSALKHRSYLWGFVITFGVYVYYDLAKLYTWDNFGEYLPVLFFIATVSALVSVWGIYKRSS